MPTLTNLLGTCHAFLAPITKNGTYFAGEQNEDR